MPYQIGDQIIHRNHGPGRITGIEEKRLADKLSMYYVVETRQVTLWVPVGSSDSTLRLPMSKPELQAHLDLIGGAGSPLPDHHRERQLVLAERMKTSTLPEACQIIRDLTMRAKEQALNKNDRDVLQAAEDLILDEWELVEGVSRDTARTQLASVVSDRTAVGKE